MKEGTVVTFYSWKGGVGRTLALANTAVQLARAGRNVLMIDWDLEAPGLDRYFLQGTGNDTQKCSISNPRNPQGLFGLLRRAKVDKDGRFNDDDWADSIRTIEVPAIEATATSTYSPKPGRLDLLPSGDNSPGYSGDLAAFSWDDFLRPPTGESGLRTQGIIGYHNTISC